MSRIRQIKPSWFLDKPLRRGTTADAREFYIGLWMLADDDGYLSWDVERIGAELYPYDPEKRRERNVDKWAAQLETLDAEAPHLVILTCGHAVVPKMPGHQRIQGTRTTSTHKRHVEGCRNARSRLSLHVATAPESLDVATRSPGRVRVGNGTEREVRNGSAGAPDAGGALGSELAEGLARHGWQPPTAKVPA